MTDLARIDSIAVGQRHRKDLGNIERLAENVDELGLLQPILITPDCKLVDGQRRIEACKLLGWVDVPVHTVPLSPVEMLRAEHDANEIRKAFTPSELVAIGRAIETEVAKQAKERQEATQAKPGERVGGETVTPPTGEKGKTREIVGRAVGVSGPTYQRAKAVVVAAEEDPNTFGDLVEKMDKTRNIKGTFDELRGRKGEAEPSKRSRPSDPKPRMMPINSAEKIVSKVSHSLHAAVVALEKVELNGAGREEVAGWIGDLEGPLRSIRSQIRTWKEHA